MEQYLFHTNLQIPILSFINGLVLLSGFYFNVDLPFSVGFINIPAFILFVPITSFMARVGANTVYKMNKLKAQRLFGVFLYVVGTIFIYRFFNI